MVRGAGAGAPACLLVYMPLRLKVHKRPINIEGKEYIYYMAWQNEKKAHWRGDIARAKLDKKREYFENKV